MNKCMKDCYGDDIIISTSLNEEYVTIEFVNDCLMSLDAKKIDRLIVELLEAKEWLTNK